MEEKVFANGIIFKLPSEKAPDFIRGSLSFKIDEAIQFLQQHNKNGWCNVSLKVSKKGKAYVELDTWEAPHKAEEPEYSPNTDPNHQKSYKDVGGFEDDIPF